MSSDETSGNKPVYIMQLTYTFTAVFSLQ